VTFDIWVLIVM